MFHHLWIGVKDVRKKVGNQYPRYFRYPNGEKLSYHDWRRGEPNGNVPNKPENCVGIYSRPIDNSFQWNDGECGGESLFVCQYDI